MVLIIILGALILLGILKEIIIARRDKASNNNAETINAKSNTKKMNLFNKRFRNKKSKLYMKVFKILDKKYLRPEMINERIILFKYRGDRFHFIVDNDTGYCYLRCDYAFENTYNLSLEQLQNIAYDAMQNCSLTKMAIYEDSIILIRDFLCFSAKQFPRKELEIYLNCMLDTLRMFMNKTEEFIKVKDTGTAIS